VSFGANLPFWEAVGFRDRLLVWMESESPDIELIQPVVNWILRQTHDDPYRGVQRQVDIAGNLWWGRIPGTVRGDRAVFCSYWIDEELRQIRCDSISTLSC
jgi:hypothetical protein